MHTNHSIVILYNKPGLNAPEDVLDIVRQAEWIAEILSAKGYGVSLQPFSLQVLEELSQKHTETPLLVFNLVDSAPGEENLAYLVPGMLEYLQLPYTGCSLHSLYTTTDKMLAKRMLRSRGIATPDWVVFGETNTFVPSLRMQYLVKPVAEDASIGLGEDSLVQADSLHSVEEAIKQIAKKTKKECFAEQFIEGREFTACMYGPKDNPVILTPYEWVFKDYEANNKAKIITYDAKWTENSFGYDHIEAKYHADEKDLPLLDTLSDIARQCWDTFSLKGYARVDFRIDEHNKPWVLEVNCNPSFYGFYHLALEGKFSFEDLVETIVEVASI
ncbi:ATP-grasp enzyme, D-alanine-D-alanine ligase [Sphaerochaeta pleomorpha str. Grapes]|uniref:ATP-grasp enzyme, D-alanine-D-alanine ligase n=1 Tax=Sphaerochaeta pleomorpha (strain ATCC BAA-1885 / DSM 22778 / Grapes) TaxID=158190 RepID=G8QQW3_SPHPG|nr:D-alanine--D-alanine ligase [Sphaerochaeta pleomorpha]AEV28744.1 ATP-grasp enzyme, D-alanine-D-alanine ligase [Sphaerochaeta pleomorpha str. Grapes]